MTPTVTRVLAPNPGPFTLEGTNTWIVRDGEAPALVIDPGPDDAAHLQEVARVAGSIRVIVLSHHHPDHAPGAAGLAARSGAPVLSAQPWEGELPLQHGEAISSGSASLMAVATPGHTSDHVAYLEPTLGALFTGDAVLGRGTSVIDPPEGDLVPYLRSLEAMRELQPKTLYPGHGPAVWDAEAKLREYIRHRQMREEQVLAALAGGPRSPEDVVPSIYGEYSKELYPAAARSVLAHLLKLEAEGTVRQLAASQAFELVR